MIIGISGKLGSGKDTLANLIIENCNTKNVQIKKFADNLKQICSIISGKPIEDMYSSEGKNKFISEFNMTVGVMQQKIGTEVFRDSFDTDVWVKSLFASYDPKYLWLVTDVRFRNEADYIKSKAGIIIRIEGDPAKVRENSKRDLNHPSETSLDDYTHFNYRIQNTGSLNDLKDQAKQIIETYNL